VSVFEISLDVSQFLNDTALALVINQQCLHFKI